MGSGGAARRPTFGQWCSTSAPPHKAKSARQSPFCQGVEPSAILVGRQRRGCNSRILPSAVIWLSLQPEVPQFASRRISAELPVGARQVVHLKDYILPGFLPLLSSSEGI